MGAETVDFESEMSLSSDNGESSSRIWDVQFDGTETLWLCNELGQLLKGDKNGSFVNYVALEKIVAVTNRDGYSLFGKVEGAALMISSNKEAILMNLNPIVYPNPIQNEAILEFYNPDNERFSLEIYDVSGRLLRQILNITDSQINISRNGLNNGFYFYKLKGAQGFASGKIVFE